MGGSVPQRDQNEGKKDLPRIAKTLLEKASRMWWSRGERRVCFQDQDKEIWMDAFRVKAVDTTAAGDASWGL